MNEDPTLFLSKVLAFEVQTILDRDRTGLLILTALDTRHSLVPTKSVIYYTPYRIQQGGRTGEVQETLQIKEVFSPFGGYHQSQLHISSRNEIRTDER